MGIYPLPWLRSISCDAHFVYFSLLQPLDTGQAPDNLPSPMWRGITVLARPEHQTKTGHYLQRVFLSSKCSFQCISRDNWGIFLLLSFDLWFVYGLCCGLWHWDCNLHDVTFIYQSFIKRGYYVRQDFMFQRLRAMLCCICRLALKMSFVIFIEDVRCFSSTHHQ